MAHILLESLIAGLGTFFGAAFVLLFGRMRSDLLSLLLGFASGVMIAVVIIDLLPSSLSYGHTLACGAGFVGGFLLVCAMDFILGQAMPGKQANRVYLRMGYLIALGIALHDLPEGVAIAAGYSASAILGPVLVLAIGLHNIPEGMATAAPLKAGGAGNFRILGVNALVSLVTPLGTLLGLYILHLSPALNALLLAAAAGAMIFIVLEKLIPESFGNHSIYAIAGIMAGFGFMYRLNLLF